MRTRNEILAELRYEKVTKVSQFNAMTNTNKSLIMAAIEIVDSVPASEMREQALGKLLEVKLLCNHAITHHWKKNGQ